MRRPTLSSPTRPLARSAGIHKGAAALLWGEPIAGCVPAWLAGHAACLRRGGNPPAPAFPLGETGKGESPKFLCAHGHYFLGHVGSRAAVPGFHSHFFRAFISGAVPSGLLPLFSFWALLSQLRSHLRSSPLRSDLPRPRSHPGCGLALNPLLRQAHRRLVSQRFINLLSYPQPMQQHG